MRVRLRDETVQRRPSHRRSLDTSSAVVSGQLPNAKWQLQKSPRLTLSLSRALSPTLTNERACEIERRGLRKCKQACFSLHESSCFRARELKGVRAGVFVTRKLGNDVVFRKKLEKSRENTKCGEWAHAKAKLEKETGTDGKNSEKRWPKLPPVDAF